MRDLGSVIELVLNAQRRIRILEPIDEASDPMLNVSKLNGRRSGKLKRENLVKKRDKDTTTDTVEDNHTEKESKIIYAKTENILTEPFEKTVEVKVSMIIYIEVKNI